MAISSRAWPCRRGYRLEVPAAQGQTARSHHDRRLSLGSPPARQAGVTHQYGDAFEIDARGHRLLVDQPVDAGGADLGPTPTELFAASLAACVCVYAMGFLRRHSLAADGLRVHCQAIMSSDCPARVAAATLRLEGLPALAEGQRAAHEGRRGEGRRATATK